MHLTPQKSARFSGASRAAAPRRCRTGSVYVAVLGVGLILSIIGLAALHFSRVETNLLAAGDQIEGAELMARSAVEFGISRMSLDAEWRSNFTNNEENPNNSWTSLGSGSFKFVLSDTDGNLNDDSADNVTVKGIGRMGNATSVETVQMQPGGAALNCLDAALHVGGNLTVVSQTITCSHFVSSNGNIFASGSVLTGDAWAVGDIQGTVGGTKYRFMSPAREMPDTSTVLDYYLANGTAININSIPSQIIQKVVLSATNNPYGATNPQGIYIINMLDKDLKIQDARIQATLVLLAPSHTPDIDNKINWEPAAPNLPALIVQGDVNMKWDGGSLLSEGATGVNFNPAHTPYMGVSDNDTSDTYPGIIKGLVYVTGYMVATKPYVNEGSTVVAGAATIWDSVNLTYHPPDRSNPPPGFSSGARMRIVPGTWRRASQ